MAISKIRHAWLGSALCLGLCGCGALGSESADDDGDTDQEGDAASVTTESTGGSAESTGPSSSTSGDGTGDDAGDDTHGEPDSDSDSDDPLPECEGGEAVTCYGGGLGTLNVGVCAAGIQSCEDGQWSDCVGEVLPSDEVCNGEDDDCDDEVDEGCECIPEHTEPCYTGPGGTQGVGHCVAGEQTCTDEGTWGACEADIVPVVETCDGTDDDCDGDVDEACECSPGDTQPCYSGPGGTEGVGQCSGGTQTCTGAAQWSACSGAVTPDAETCNGEDDDCDGVIDDLALGDSCDTTEPGLCGVGQQACEDAGLVCEQAVTPVIEVCDDLDNDCDGDVDEGLVDDPILIDGELPDTWANNIPLVGSYPGASVGVVPGRLHEVADEDWLSVFAQEQVFDIVGDTPVVGSITIESPGPEFSYEACACWSTSSSLCGKTQGSASMVCAVSNGGAAQLQVSMAMILAATDEGYLDVVVRPEHPTEVGCDLYEVGWFVSEP